MRRGILDLVGLAATLVFALPLGVAGLGFVWRGQVAVGLALVGVGVGMVVTHEYITTPGDVPELIARRITGRLLGGHDDEE